MEIVADGVINSVGELLQADKPIKIIIKMHKYNRLNMPFSEYIIGDGTDAF